MTDVPVIRSTRYTFVTRLRRVRRRDVIWVGDDPRSQWVIIPQKISSIHSRFGEHCLVHDRALICRLREGQGYQDNLVLMGRDGGGADWLAAPKVAPDIWALFKRQGVNGPGSRQLPDGYLNGATSGTGVERLVAAALVLASIAFETGSDLPGRPDFIIPGRKIAVFAHGCHHHAHQCGLVRGYGDQPTAEEMADIQEYDSRVVASLINHGWRVLTVWECAVMQNAALADLPGRLRDAVNSSATSIKIAGQ